MDGQGARRSSRSLMFGCGVDVIAPCRFVAIWHPLPSPRMTTFAQLLLSLASSQMDPSAYEPRSVGYFVMELFPFVVLFMVFGGLAVVLMGWQAWNRDRLVLKSIQQLELPPSAKVLDRELDKLCQRDPAFSRSAFEREVSGVFARIRFVDERTRLLRMMAALARSDGAVSRQERALLKVCSRRWGIPFEEIRPVIEGSEAPADVAIEKGSWPARAFLEGLCEAAAIDGVIDRRERSLIVKLAKHLGVDAPTAPALQSRADAVRRAIREANGD